MLWPSRVSWCALAKGLTWQASPLATDADGVIATVSELLGAARAPGVSVFYTTVAYTPYDRLTARVPREGPSLRMLEASSGAGT